MSMNDEKDGVGDGDLTDDAEGKMLMVGEGERLTGDSPGDGIHI